MESTEMTKRALLHERQLGQSGAFEALQVAIVAAVGDGEWRQLFRLQQGKIACTNTRESPTVVRSRNKLRMQVIVRCNTTRKNSIKIANEQNSNTKQTARWR